MFKRLTIVICAVLALLLTGCTGLGTPVEELLQAPALTDDQTAVLETMDASQETAIKLKYPSSGEYRTPIQFLDIDSDGEDEALLCYTTGDNVYARFAVLDKKNDVWSIKGDMEGPGTDIYSIGFLKESKSRTQFFYIEWSSINKTEHTLVIYEYKTGLLEETFSQDCIKLLVADINQDSYSELCVIYTESTDGPYVLRCIGFDNGEFKRMGHAALQSDMLGCIGLMTGPLPDGLTGIFIDENVGGGRQVTEAFCSVDGQFTRADYASLDLSAHTLRSADSFSSRLLEHAGYVCMPRQENDSALSGWYRWYTVRDGSVELAFSTYASVTLGYAAAVPEEYYGRLEAVQDDSESRRLAFYLKNEEEPRSLLLEIKVLSPGEEASIYINEGFVGVGSTDRYRYYIRLGDNAEFSQYVMNNFMVLG